MKYIIIAASVIVALILLSVAISVSVKIFRKSQTSKMYSTVEDVLLDFSHKNNANLEVFMKPEYDYILKTKTKKIYIKILSNPGGHEITVNNSVKWQLRRALNDDNLKFVEGIDQMMRMDIPPKEEGLETKKLYVIYPNARSLLKYINECEMEFVYPNTDVYGTNVITFVDLREHPNIIE